MAARDGGELERERIRAHARDHGGYHAEFDTVEDEQGGEHGGEPQYGAEGEKAFAAVVGRGEAEHLEAFADQHDAPP